MRGIMREYLLRWTLNGMPQAPFLCSEGEGEALLLGHLVASGMVDEAGDIQSIWYDNGLWTVQALLKEGAAIPALMRLDGLKPLESALSLPASEIIACCEQVMGLDHAPRADCRWKCWPKPPFPTFRFWSQRNRWAACALLMLNSWA